MQRGLKKCIKYANGGFILCMLLCARKRIFFNVCMLCHQVFGSGQVDP